MRNIRLSKSVMGKKETHAVSKVILQDGYLGMGKWVQSFEERLKTFIGCDNRHVLCVNSGTAALHLAVMAAGLKSGDEVLVQSLTFVATFQAVSAAGAKPVPCEIIPETCTLDLQYAEKKITERTKAVMPVHYASRTGNLDDVYTFAEKHHLRVIEDAAHAFGTLYHGKKIGSFGDIACFSFDGIKNITSGEGGAVVTSDEKVAQFVRDARLLGVHKDTEKRYQGERSWEFDVSHQGYRYHMSNLFAALGIIQLERFETEFKPARQRLAKRYNEALKNIKSIVLFSDDYTTTVPHLFVIRVKGGKRDVLRRHLLDNGIECGVHYYPNHLLSFYGGGKDRLPVTEKVHNELLSIPLHPEITEEEQDVIIKTIKGFFK